MPEPPYRPLSILLRVFSLLAASSLLGPPGLGRFSSLFAALLLSKFLRRGLSPLAAQHYSSGVLPFCHSRNIKAASDTETNSS
jgi:hypothetical protein